MTIPAARPTDPAETGEPADELRVIGVEEHVWTAEIRDALARDG